MGIYEKVDDIFKPASKKEVAKRMKSANIDRCKGCNDPIPPEEVPYYCEVCNASLCPDCYVKDDERDWGYMCKDCYDELLKQPDDVEEDIFKPAKSKEIKTRKEQYLSHLPKTYKEWGLKNNMPEEMADAFDKYMSARWGNRELNTSYGEEWLQRFKYRDAWNASDGKGQEILKRIGYYDGPHKW